MKKEFEFLKIISDELDDSSYLGDDCAFLKKENIAVSTDTLIEDVHFSRQYMTTSEIARKAMLSNISDAIASGGKIKYALICLSGKFDINFIKEFYKEINLIAKAYDFKIIGGDLTKSDKIFINITVFADTKNRNISSRYNAKEGYITAVSGVFGSSQKGLEELKKGIKKSNFINSHKSPLLYPKIGDFMSKTKKPYAMMDSSDGLMDCLYQISEKSKVKISIEYNKIPKKTDDKSAVLYGGEDYCLVICANKDEIKNIKGLTIIGKVEKGEGVYIDNIEEKNIESKGFKHFE